MSNYEEPLAVAPGEEIVSDSRCFVCGMANVGGLKVRFFRKGDCGALATCTPADTFMGYDGLLHGGVAASLLDEIMIKAVLAAGHPVVTGRMSVQYHRPVTLGQKLHLEGTLTGNRGRIYETSGSIYVQADEPLVTAVGTYVELRGTRRRELLEGLERQRTAGGSGSA